MQEDPSTWQTIIAEIVTFAAGGGLFKLISLNNKKKKENVKNISDLSYTFRKNLEVRLDKLELENETKEKQILDLATKLAKFETENKLLKAKIKELEALNK